jgi:hypothetical protein
MDMIYPNNIIQYMNQSSHHHRARALSLLSVCVSCLYLDIAHMNDCREKKRKKQQEKGKLGRPSPAATYHLVFRV